MNTILWKFVRLLSPKLQCEKCGNIQRKGDWEQIMNAQAKALGMSRFVSINSPQCLKCEERKLKPFLGNSKAKKHNKRSSGQNKEKRRRVKAGTTTNQKFRDKEDTRTWQILKDLDRIEATEKHPDFDVAYLRAAYPTGHAEDHQNANLDILLAGLEKSLVKSRILARLSAYYAWNGDVENALKCAVHTLLALNGPPSSSHLQPVALLQQLFVAKGYKKEAAELWAIQPDYDFGSSEKADVVKAVKMLTSRSHKDLVEQARKAINSKKFNIV